MKFAAILPLFYASTHAATWSPGDFSDGTMVQYNDHLVFLSNGLNGRVLAAANEPIIADDGSTLAMTHHSGNDGGGCIPHKDGSGGYFYVSNSEIGSYPSDLTGGSYAFEFNAAHELIGYKQVLQNTALNCHGGVTPWNTWISCEEHLEFGRCWQVDPHGEIDPVATDVTGALGIVDYGNWEAFAWDSEREHAYVTNDDIPTPDSLSYKGAIVRYTPNTFAKDCLLAGDDSGKWCALNSGTHDYLKLNTDGTFEWVANLEDSNPDTYAGSEGVDVTDGMMTFVSVRDKLLFRLNLDTMTYTVKSVPFPQEPDNIRMLGDALYLCTDGDYEPNDAIWRWDPVGASKIVYEENHNYPAGVSFSPDAKMMYVSFWGEATWQFWRDDGLRFDDETAGITYEHGVGLDAAGF